MKTMNSLSGVKLRKLVDRLGDKRAATSALGITDGRTSRMEKIEQKIMAENGIRHARAAFVKAFGHLP
jgi:hypothetical protein